MDTQPRVDVLRPAAEQAFVSRQRDPVHLASRAPSGGPAGTAAPVPAERPEHVQEGHGPAHLQWRAAPSTGRCGRPVHLQLHSARFEFGWLERPRLQGCVRSSRLWQSRWTLFSRRGRLRRVRRMTGPARPGLVPGRRDAAHLGCPSDTAGPADRLSSRPGASERMPRGKGGKRSDGEAWFERRVGDTPHTRYDHKSRPVHARKPPPRCTAIPYHVIAIGQCVDRLSCRAPELTLACTAPLTLSRHDRTPPRGPVLEVQLAGPGGPG